MPKKAIFLCPKKAIFRKAIEKLRTQKLQENEAKTLKDKEDLLH